MGAGMNGPELPEVNGKTLFVRNEFYTAALARADRAEALLAEAVKALRWIEDRRAEAVVRATAITDAPEDKAVLALCRKHGFGAVMDSAARQWAEIDNSGAFFIGGCLGDTSARAILARAEPIPAAHPDDLAVDRFAAAMKAKMASARAKGRSGWDNPSLCSDAYLARLLMGHIGKTNPGTFEDIANFCMMLHQRDADPSILPSPDTRVAAEGARADKAEALLAEAVEALQDAERFMAYFSGETGGSFAGPGTPSTCLSKIRAFLARIKEAKDNG